MTFDEIYKRETGSDRSKKSFDDIYKTETGSEYVQPEQFKEPATVNREEKPKKKWWQTAGDFISGSVADLSNSFYQLADFIIPDEAFNGGDNAVSRALDAAKGITKKQADEKNKIIQSQNSNLAKYGLMAADNAIQMLPDAALAIATGGGSAAASISAKSAAAQTAAKLAASKGIKSAAKVAPDIAKGYLQTISKNPNYYLSVSKTLGRGYEEALEEGATNEQALASSIINSLLGSAVEVGGGIQKPAAERTVRNWVKSAFEEGKEEVVQGVIENLTKKVIYDKDKNMFGTDGNAVIDPNRAIQEFAGGAAVGGILGGAQMGANALIDKVSKNYTDSAIRKQNDQENPAISENVETESKVVPVEKEANLEVTKDMDLEPSTDYSQQEADEAVLIESAKNVPSYSERPLNALQTEENGIVEDAESEINEAIKKYGKIKQGENPINYIEVPKKLDDDTKVSQFYRTIEEVDPSEEIRDKMKKDLVKGRFSYVPVSDKSALLKADQTIERVGFDGAVNAWRGMIDTKSRLDKKDFALGERILKTAMDEGNAELAADIAVDLTIESRNAAQLLQATRMLKKFFPKGVAEIVQLEKIEKKLQKQADGKYDISLDQKYIDEIKKADGNQEKIDALVTEAMRDMVKNIPASWVDKWNAWRYTAMLANALSNVRNISGNGIFYPIVYARDLLSAAMESAFNVKDRTKSADVLFKTERGKKYIDFAKKYWGEIEKTATKTDLKNPNDFIQDNRTIFKTKWLENVRKLSSNLLEKEDKFFKKIHFVREMANYLAARDVDISKKIDEKTLQNASTYALNEAAKDTFNDYSEVAAILNDISRKNKAFQLLIEGNVPFKKTPINIMKRGLEYSPAGIAKGIYDGASKVKNGKMDASEFIDEISAGLTGTGILAIGALLQSLGMLQASFRRDDPEDDLKRKQGLQEYSLVIGDKSYTLDWAAPSVFPLFVGAEAFRETESDEGFSFSNFLSSLSKISEPIINMSMLQGINDALEATGSSENKIASFLESTATNYVGQAVPTALGQVTRIFDDKQRRNYVASGESFPVAKKGLQKAIGKIPGLAQTKQPYVDYRGEEKDTGSFADRVIGNLMSPGYMSEVKSSPVDDVLLDIYKSTGNRSVLPKAAKKSFYSGKDNYNLTAQEYTDWQKIYGGKSFETLSDVLDYKPFAESDENTKSDIVENINKYAQEIAKVNFFAGRNKKYVPDSIFTKTNEAVENGIPAHEYITFRTIKAGLRKDEVVSMINSMDAGADAKNWLYLSCGYAGSGLNSAPWNNSQSSSGQSEIDKEILEKIIRGLFSGN